MASPNAAGCLALLLSALKQEEIEYNPFLIRLSLENTAQKSDDAFSVGCGLIQIHKAFDYLRSLGKPSPLTRIHLQIFGGQGRGIYLREFEQVQQSSGDIRLTIRPKYFSKDDVNRSSTALEGSIVRLSLSVFLTNVLLDQEKKIDYNSRLALLSDPPASYVQHGKFLDLSYQDRTFDIRLDPSQLKEDQVHFTQLQVFDLKQIAAGPLARFPITIIKPMT